MAKLTPKQYIAKLKKQQAEIKRTNRPLFLAASTVHADIVERIFVKGRSSTGKIGKYTSLPYKELRQKKGRQTAFVNLRFTGDLEVDFSNSLRRETPTKWVAGTTKARETTKAEHIIERYGDVFKFSNKEKKKYLSILQKELLKILQ